MKDMFLYCIDLDLHSPMSLLFYQILRWYISVMGVMKMGNIVPKAGIEPITLVLQPSVLPLHHVGSLMSPLYPHPPVYVAACLRGQCRVLHSSPWNCKSCNAYNYIHIGNGFTYTYTG